MKAKKNDQYDLFNALGDNGWQWVRYDTEDDYYKFKCTFSLSYRIIVQACVSVHQNHLCVDGHYGVLWVECIGWPDWSRGEDVGFGYSDLTCMQNALIKAEENLLRCGIPFSPEHRFLGKNAENKKRRNDALRKKYNLAEIEKKDIEKE